LWLIGGGEEGAVVTDLVEIWEEGSAALGTDSQALNSTIQPAFLPISPHSLPAFLSSISLIVSHSAFLPSIGLLSQLHSLLIPAPPIPYLRKVKEMDWNLLEGRKCAIVNGKPSCWISARIG
jgi:hypothetical protein